MEIKKLIETVEKFAPINTQEKWDNSGWQINYNNLDVKKIMLCLTPTKDIIKQAKNEGCELIISHHPLFFVPFEFNQGVEIYSAHTNLDKADGGTTDTLIKNLGLEISEKIDEFLRISNLKHKTQLDEILKLIKERLNIQNLRFVNNQNQTEISKIAFCAGSGADFINLAKEHDVDAFVTGDVKYHTALESNVIIIDIGHFESEYPVLKTLENLLKDNGVEIVFADEKSPFLNY